MTYLLDTNGVIAYLVDDHEHHRAAHRFFRRRPFAICPTTQLGVLRFLTRPTRSGETVFPPLESPTEAWRKLKVLCNTRAKPFVPDDVNASQAPFEWVTGYLQWTDFYLVGVARAHKFKLATFDDAIAEFFPDHVTVIPR